MKNYVKPELFYERYELSQHIADCAWEYVNSTQGCEIHADPDQIGWPGTLFTDACELDESNYEDLCYQNGSGGANTFVS